MYHFIENSNSLAIKKIKTGLNTKIIGNDIILFDSVTSTMDIAREKIASNVSEGLTIFAEHQSGGKGRRGRVWSCPKKKGILATVILQPNMQRDQNFFLMGIAAIAVAEAINHFLHIQVEVKWPNDIIIDNKKVAGILMEVHSVYNQALTFAIGIGVNVNLTKEELPDKPLIPATSLAMEAEFIVDRNKLAQILLQSLDMWYLYLKENQYEFIRERWRVLCLAFNQKLTISEENNNYTGKFVDITSKGDLILELEDNTKKKIRGEYATLVT